ncbi:MAG TPA: hypothetical protein VJN63_08665 [Thermoplasmata archaeon]|nr:hypothetical protein [Thermoplasmata archaeon]
MNHSTGTRRGLVLFTGLLLVLGYAAGTARAALTGTSEDVESAITEAIVLPMNGYAAYNFTLATGEALVYSVEVTDGGAIDVYLVPPVGLAKYTTGSSSTFDRYQEFPDQRAVSGTLPDVTGQVTVIVDNANVSAAQPTGVVSVSVGLFKSSNIVLGGILFILCGAGILGSVAIILAVRRRKARIAQPPFPPGGPPEALQVPETPSFGPEHGPPSEPPRP